MYTVLYNQNTLQGDFSKWRTSFIRETRDASTSTKSYAQKFLANAAAATAVAARHFCGCIVVKEEMKIIQATQQRSQKHLTTGNCCGSDVPNITHVEEKPEFKLWWKK